jgi:hypothetical protein
MPSVELRQRLREQEIARKEQLLKYRGVSYIKESYQIVASK